jgi:hypothetical protein
VSRIPRASDSWRRYEAIQAFKEDPRAVSNGINYARVIALYLYDTTGFGWIKKLSFSLFFAPSFRISDGCAKTLLFYSYRSKGRRDYDYIFDRLVSLASPSSDHAECRERASLRQMWRTLRRLPEAWPVAAAYPAGLWQRISAAALVAKYLSIADAMGKRLLPGRIALVTFCDAAPHDNLLTQLAKAGGARTVTAQHGQYRLLDESNMSPDAEAYANFVSDHLLAWGPATQTEFGRFGIDAGRLTVVGWIRKWDLPQRSSGATRTLGVMLNGENGAESNLALLDVAREIAERLDHRIVVRLHPSFSESSYRRRAGDRCSAVEVIPAPDYLTRVDFSIAHMSGAAIEMLYVESPVYLLDDGRLADVFRHPGLTFEDADAMEAAIRADLARADRGRARVRELRRWFNDDSEQDERIRATIFAGGV